MTTTNEQASRSPIEDVTAALVLHLGAIEEQVRAFIDAQPDDPSDLHPALTSDCLLPMPSGAAIMESVLHEEASRRREAATHEYEALLWEIIASTVWRVIGEVDRGYPKYEALMLAVAEADDGRKLVETLRGRAVEALREIHRSLTV